MSSIRPLELQLYDQKKTGAKRLRRTLVLNLTLFDVVPRDVYERENDAQ